MVRSLTSSLALVLVLSLPALAAPGGEYRVQGHDGAQVEGWVAIEARPGGIYVDRKVAGRSRLRGWLQERNGSWKGTLTTSGGAVGALAGPADGRSLELTVTRRQGSDRDLDAEWVERAPRRISIGVSRWRLRSRTSTIESAPLMQSIVRNALRTVRNGNVPSALMLTEAGNRVEPRLKVEGPEIFAGAAALIVAAEEEVLIQTFHWAPSEAADTIMAALKALEARRRAANATTPVRVRFVVDRNRLLKALRYTLRDLEANIRATRLDPRYVTTQVASSTHWLYGALHSKVFVVDGRHALITGSNVNEWAQGPQTWYELGLVVHGPVAASLRAEFDDLWAQKYGSSLAPLQTAPLPATGPGVKVLVTSRKSNGNVFQDNDENPASQGYFSLLRGAQRHVRIMTPHLNDDGVRRELIACVKRGVTVQVVLSKGFGLTRMKLPFQGGSNTKNLGRLYRRLKQHPAALARFQVRWFSRDGQTPVDGEARNSHAKYMTCDDSVAIIGNSNLDEQSFNHSREVNLVIEDAALIRGFDRQVFLPVFKRAIPVDLRNP
ncbi:MAG: phosphatidylserine/phosphatidylglycerophosphate/cardiolipin synthase family protein [Planctomycetes bacterium]|nr:phosphatidylserine/phosphatidylglycerophosphate/cardiolipin synthase family protein [Planctomycetota bacterium]